MHIVDFIFTIWKMFDRLISGMLVSCVTFAAFADVNFNLKN